MDLKASQWRPGQNVCRCCLTEGCYKDISSEYFWMGKREVYTEMLSDCFGVTICQTPPISSTSVSRLICDDCVSRLRDASNFKRQVLDCEKMFKQYLEPAVDETGIEFSADLLKVKRESVKTEIDEADDSLDQNVEYLEDDAFDDLDDEPLTKLASKTKKESVDIMDLLDNEKFSKAPEPKAAIKRKSTIIVKATPPKKSKPQKVVKAAEPTTSSSIKDDKKKGIIETTNSSITIKYNDGSDIKLTLLKNPIPLDILEYENTRKKTPKRKNKQRKKYKHKVIDDDAKLINISLLKDPICLDDIRSGDDAKKPVTITAQTVQSTYLCGPSRRRVNAIESLTWKQNALTLFEFSHVYPFVYTNNKYKCFVCSREFLETSLLKHHTNNEHNFEDIKKELNNKGREKYLKVDVSLLECKLCLQMSTDLKSLKNHLKIIHKKDIDMVCQDNIVPFKLGDNVFDCQICDESFLKLRLLIIHMSKHFNNYSCEVCGSVFISLDLLKRHLQTHETGNFPCDRCDKVFSNAAKRSIHMRGVHLKQYPRRCPICPERFNSNYQRTKHLRIVHNQSSGLFRCETCGREYDLKYHLLIHIRSVHLQERNQECMVCHARFFSKESLNRHMVIHTGEKNYKCEVCCKAYARRKNLREHLRTHELNHCSACGQSFGDHHALAAHVNNVHAVISH